MTLGQSLGHLPPHGIPPTPTGGSKKKEKKQKKDKKYKKGKKEKERKRKKESEETGDNREQPLQRSPALDHKEEQLEKKRRKSDLAVQPKLELNFSLSPAPVEAPTNSPTSPAQEDEKEEEGGARNPCR